MMSASDREDEGTIGDEEGKIVTLHSRLVFCAALTTNACRISVVTVNPRCRAIPNAAARTLSHDTVREYTTADKYQEQRWCGDRNKECVYNGGGVLVTHNHCASHTCPQPRGGARTPDSDSR
jgi:hypothetical protein